MPLFLITLTVVRNAGQAFYFVSQLGLAWYFSDDSAGVTGFWEDHLSSAILFTPYWGHILLTHHCWCSILSPGCGDGVRFSTVQLLYFPLLTLLFGKKSLHAAYTQRVGSYALPPWGHDSYINYLKCLWTGDFSFLSFLFNYLLAYTEYLFYTSKCNAILSYCSTFPRIGNC